MKQDEGERSRIGHTKRGVCNEYRKWKKKLAGAGTVHRRERSSF